MNKSNQRMLNYLRSEMFPPESKLSDIYRTYKECSKDESNNRFLVTSEIKAISYDLLVKRIYREKRQNKPKTADAMTFSDAHVVLIEFKTGDQTYSTNRKIRLIKNVTGKINNSEQILFRDIAGQIENINQEELQLAFYLVVDAKEMGIDSRLAVLLQKSLGSVSLKEAKLDFLINELLPELKNQVEHPEKYADIDIWYADIFETYLFQYGIKDIEDL